MMEACDLPNVQTSSRDEMSSRSFGAAIGIVIPVVGAAIGLVIGLVACVIWQASIPSGLAMLSRNALIIGTFAGVFAAMSAGRVMADESGRARGGLALSGGGFFVTGLGWELIAGRPFDEMPIMAGAMIAIGLIEAVGAIPRN